MNVIELLIDHIGAVFTLPEAWFDQTQFTSDKCFVDRLAREEFYHVACIEYTVRALPAGDQYLLCSARCLELNIVRVDWTYIRIRIGSWDGIAGFSLVNDRLEDNRPAKEYILRAVDIDLD